MTYLVDNLLTTGDADVRADVVRALAPHYATDGDARAALLRLADDSDVDVRSAASAALGL